MIRTLNIVLVVLVVALSIALYDIKYRAEAAGERVKALEEEIASEREAIRVLRAEWSYLNQPSRLAELAQRYLELQPLKASQIATFSDLPMPPQPDNFYGPLGRRPMGGYAGVAGGGAAGGGGTVR